MSENKPGGDDKIIKSARNDSQKLKKHPGRCV